MNKQMMNMEELEPVHGGYKYEKKKVDHNYSTVSQRDVVIDGVTYLGVKVVEGANWLWNGIKSIL